MKILLLVLSLFLLNCNGVLGQKNNDIAKAIEYLNNDSHPLSVRIEFGENVISNIPVDTNKKLKSRLVSKHIELLQANQQYKESIQYIENLKNILKEDESIEFANLLLLEGRAYSNIGLYNYAKISLLRSSDFFESNTDYDGVINAWKLLGTIHYRKREYSEGINVFLSAIEHITKKGKTPDNLTYFNVGSCYLNTQQLDSAFYFLSKAEELERISPSEDYPFLQNILCSKLALLFSFRKDRLKTTEYLTNAKVNFEKLNIRYQTSIELDRSQILINEGRLSEARKQLHSIKETQVSSHHIRKLEIGLHIARQTGNFDEYVSWQNALNLFKDSILNISEVKELDLFSSLINSLNKQNQIVQEKLKQEMKDEQEKSMLTAVNEKYYRILFFTSIILIVLILLFMYYRRRYQSTRTENDSLMKEINRQKSSILDLVTLIEQNEKIIERTKKDLVGLKQQIKKHVDDHSLERLIFVLNLCKKLNSDLIETPLISKMNSRLNRALEARFQRLNSKDIDFIKLLKLNLSSKEMSILTSLTPESIDVKKSRMRKKLQIENRGNLDKLIDEVLKNV